MTRRHARLVPNVPPALSAGGFERQYQETLRALDAAGKDRWDCRALDLAVEDPVDVLHGFGSTSVQQWLPHVGSRPLVVSAMTGTAVFDRRRHVAKVGHARLAARLRATTPHEQAHQVLARADAVLVQHPAEEHYLRATHGLGTVHVVPNGVDERFRIASPAPFVEAAQVQDFVLFVGALIPRKNPLLLARACVDLGQPLVLLGSPGPQDVGYWEELRALLERHPTLLTHRHTLAHHDPLLASAYAAASLFCLPSDQETQPLTVMEAMATGRPVAVGDRPYALQPPYDMLARLPLDSYGAFVRALETALAEAVPVELPATYSWEAVAQRILAVYDEVLR